MKTDHLVITIDGPSGAGKSTLARLLARQVVLRYLDTGALYRAVAVEAIRRQIDIENAKQLEDLCRSLDIRIQWVQDRLLIVSSGRDVSAEIRSEIVGQMASRISAKAPVRKALLGLQRQVIEQGGAVLEGRDTGTVVAPTARVKFFLDADPAERGRRRLRELHERGIEETLESVVQSMRQRDLQDQARDLAPLRPAQDAVIIDTTGKSISEVLEEMLAAVRDRLSREV